MYASTLDKGIGEMVIMYSTFICLTLPNDKMSDMSKLKLLADGMINPTKKLEFVLGWAQNIEGARQNAGYLHFLLFHNVFKRLIFKGR